MDKRCLTSWEKKASANLKEKLKVIERVTLISFNDDFINLWIAFKDIAGDISDNRETSNEVLNPTGNFLNSFTTLQTNLKFN